MLFSPNNRLAQPPQVNTHQKSSPINQSDPPQQLLGDHLQLVREDHHVVTVPANTPAHIQQDSSGQRAAEILSRDDLSWMIVAGIEAQSLYRVRAVDQDKTRESRQRRFPSRTRKVCPRRHSEYSGDRAERQRRRPTILRDARARSFAVDGRVLTAVRDPDVGRAGRTRALPIAVPICRQAIP